MSIVPHVLVAGPLSGREVGDVVPLPERTVHHLRRALRRVDGTPLSITDGAGAQVGAELVAESARLMAAPEIIPAPAPRIVLAQALAKGRRTDDAVRMACELGVDRIVPVIADRTQGRPGERSGAVVERWQAIAIAALEQSRGVHLADVAASRTSRELAGEAGEGGETARTARLVALPGAAALPEVLNALASATGTSVRDLEEVQVAVGPEGGWSAAEVDLLVGGGWSAVGLGPTVLRTEHAGPIAIAVLAALSGRWMSHSRAPTYGAGRLDAYVTPSVPVPPVEEHRPL